MVSADRTAGAAVDDIEARLSKVMAELTSVAAGSSLCMISRSTGPVDGAKYLEGRMAALSELKRAARRRPGAGLADVASPIVRQWRSDLELQQERGARVGWVAYRAGGVDALTELLE